MGKQARVSLSPAAQRELQEIWAWNAEYYDRPHADRYLQFLLDRIAELGHAHSEGLRVSTRADLRYMMFRRRSGGHGHVAVYRFDDKTVEVLHVFHTAQDWQGTLSTEKP